MKRFACVLAVLAIVGWAACAQAALIAYYTAEEAASPLYDSVGTQTAVDNGGGGTLYHQAGVPAGTYGAITLASSSGYAVGLSNTASQWSLSVADSAELNLTNDFTAMGWLYMPSGFGTQVATMIGRGLVWGGRGWGFGARETGANKGVVFSGYGVNDWYSGDSITWSQWHHIAVTKSSTGGVEFYLDGNLTKTVAGATGNFNAQIDPDVFVLGRHCPYTAETISGGKMDELRVYNTVLGLAEIRAAAANVYVPEPSALVLLATGLVGLLCYAWRKRK